MSPNTNPKVPTPSNPSSLKPQYEIRKLDPAHLPWATAILIHSNLFYSPVWPVLYPSNLTARLFAGLSAAEYLITHQINSGLSYGVFDTTYKFKRAESKATGGKLYWDPNEASIQDSQGVTAEADRLLAQMDFPLVSIAMSYDAFDALDMEKMGAVMEVLPHFGLLYHILEERDTRDKETWGPKKHGEVLFRNATSTRHDYEGEGLMGGLARWLMREAAMKGFRAIQIECVNDAVTRVWERAEEPFVGMVVSEFHTGTWVDERGVKAFEPAEQRITKCFVDLKGKA